MQALPVFTFANQAGLDMLETTLVALQDITLDKILDDHGRKSLCTEFPQIMQQGFACLQGGLCLSSMGRPVSYERAVAWKAQMGTPEAHTLARWISHSYRCYLGVELLKSGAHGNESVLKSLWHQSDAIMCCSLKALPVFTFANQAGLDMLETTLVALQDITLDKILDDHGRKSLCTEFPQIMQQGFACLQGGLCLSSMGRPVSYERAVAWKVLNEEENAHCICFMFINWSFV
ncbi:homeobox-leucine zipper protein ATHB-15 [Artemisia annua]|uniref:Homeobox-leucine zipper protein ATHB-15 n=1 Tax=Artemisia annua TaxID=35608 RepID=A0A2U1KWK2_ARTAN|nr:homeobox-leucine zipper protein ATHB-15 [Artemisia annua]